MNSIKLHIFTTNVPQSDIIIIMPYTFSNDYFIKSPMIWWTIHFCLMQSSDLVMKAMHKHEVMSVLPKIGPNDHNKSLCTIYATEKNGSLTKRENIWHHHTYIWRNNPHGIYLLQFHTHQRIIFIADHYWYKLLHAMDIPHSQQKTTNFHQYIHPNQNI